MSIRSSPAGTAAAPQGDRLKTVLSAGLGRLSLHCTPCNATVNMCTICSSLLAGPAQADPSLPDALERVRASGNWYHRWCLAQWVWTHETDPNTRVRIQPSEIEELLLFRPVGVNVWPIPVQPQQTEKQRAIDEVTEDGDALGYLPKMRGDRDVVLAAVAQNGRALEYASYALRGDKEVVLVAVRQEGSALEYASDAFHGDKDVMLAAVAQYGTALRLASDALKNDKDVVLAAVADHGMALKFASDALKNDKDVVLAAVREYRYAFRLASDVLQTDPDVVRAFR